MQVRHMPELPCFQKTKITGNALFAFELDILGNAKFTSVYLLLLLFKVNKLLISLPDKCGQVLPEESFP